MLYELVEYCPPHLFTISNFGTELTPSTFAMMSSTSLKFIVLLNVQLLISKYFPGDKSLNILAIVKKIKIKKILKSRDDFYAFSNFKYTFLNIKKEDLNNARITLTIYRDRTPSSSTNYAHSCDENEISTLFDF